MSLYRLKSEPVEAWCHDGTVSKANQLRALLGPHVDYYWADGETVIRVRDWHWGYVEAESGDWIVRQQDGSVRTYTNAELRARYEPVEPGLAA